MNVRIQSVNFTAKPELEEFVNEKVGKLFQFFDGIISIDVNLKAENKTEVENKEVDIKLLIPGNDLFAKKSAKTFEEATDVVVDALKKQITKHKEKLKNI